MSDMNIDGDALDNALRTMGKKQLKPEFRDAWVLEVPRNGYCYVIAEVLYHYTARDGFTPRVVKNTDGSTHWYLENDTGRIIDPVIDPGDVDPGYYARGKKHRFRTATISKRGAILASLLHLQCQLR
jgi:hypothetical protein